MNDEAPRPQPTALPARPLRPPVAAVVLACVVFVLAVVQVRGWDGRTNADGVSYLDLAARYGAGDWRALANGYWSPLYPLLLGAALRLARVASGDGAAELRTVFAVNVAILTGTALAFARLARVMLTPARPHPSQLVTALRAAAAGALCVFAEIRLINATTITPDGLLAGILFLVSADLALAAGRGSDRRRDLRVGALLALGFWTKAVFFPVAVVSMAAYVLATRPPRNRRVLPRVLLTAILAAAPLIAVQSWSQGRPSFGETGRLNYRWFVLGGEHAEPVTEPVEATRRRTTPAAVALDGVPGAVLFAGEAHGSFPYWYDPSRYEPPGIGTLALQPQWTIFRFNLHWLRVTAGLLASMAAIAIGAALARGRPRWRRLWMTVPAVTTLVLYLLTHPEGRMGAAPIACVLLAMLALVEVGRGGRRWAALVVEGAALGAFGAVALGRTSNRVPSAPTHTLAAAGALAGSLRAAGLHAGDEIGVVGDGYGLRWAHEIGARVVVTVPTLSRHPTVDDATLVAAAAESAARGHPLRAFVYPVNAAVESRRAIPVRGGWLLWPAPEQSR